MNPTKITTRQQTRTNGDKVEMFHDCLTALPPTNPNTVVHPALQSESIIPVSIYKCSVTTTTNIIMTTKDYIVQTQIHCESLEMTERTSQPL